MTKPVDLRPHKHWLQRGELTEISEEVGVKRSQQANILAGRSQNWTWVQKFWERVERNMALAQKSESI